MAHSANRFPPRSDGEADKIPARVEAHYDRWPFPGVDHSSREGLILLRTLSQWLKRPAGDIRTRRIIDVGCGTGHTVLALARHFPEAQFMGIDAAEEALEAARAQAASAGVSNISFERADIDGELPAWGTFDVVLCLGVLHHVPELAPSFGRVAGLLSDSGHLVLWLYGRFGRARHSLNQRFLELLGGVEPQEDRLTLARVFLEELGSDFAVDSGFYTPRGSGEAGVEWLLERPQWLADQMIPAYEQSVSLGVILDLFANHGLEFVRWLGVPTDLAHHTKSPVLLDRFRRLAPRDRLQAIDYLVKPAYYFIAARKYAAEGVK